MQLIRYFNELLLIIPPICEGVATNERIRRSLSDGCFAGEQIGFA